ncbi:MAG: M48 family metalloprotease [Candidatus Methylomirabilales bacterium]
MRSPALPWVSRRDFLRLVAAIGLGGLLFLVLPLRAARAVTVISEAKEAAIGRRAHREILKQFGYLDHAALQAYVTRVGRQVLAASEPTGFDFLFTVVDSPIVNAFATPGGFVYVTRGLLATLNSEAELAGVLGHEIAHVTSHHFAKAVTRGLAANILALGLAAVSPGGRENMAGWLALSQALFNQIALGYSREAEIEADEKGVRAALGANYDPRGMLAFMRSMQLHARLAGIGYHAAGATHPETGERIDRVRVMLQVLREDRQVDLRVLADVYKSHLEGLAYGKRGEKKRIRIVKVRAGQTLADLSRELWGTPRRAWDIGFLNGFTDETTPLRAGAVLKVIEDPFDLHGPIRLPDSG